ncbi:hypothetical protein ACH5RR_031859 [Cinchona calisaya]|uniref:RRM domain-containing protein n=1 Tax=Cinchona calisaya TaxID=153742 RepID=A0ABD2YKV7_9GENT
MAFFNRVGSLLRQSLNNNALLAPLPMSSMFNSIRCMSSSRLFVGGLPWGTDDSSLKEAFSGFGEVIDAKVITDRESGKSKGFGFISFSSRESASSALSAMDGQALQGRNIRVSYAEERSGPRGNFGRNFENSGGF